MPMTAPSAGFTDKKVMAELTAKMLLEVEAVRFMADKPFIFTSGWASPVYTDCRRLISFPRVRKTLIDFGVATVFRDAGFEQFDTVVGGKRSEERRVGKECRARWARGHESVEMQEKAHLRGAHG